MAIDAAAAVEWPDGNDVPAAALSGRMSGRARSTISLMVLDSSSCPPSTTAKNSGMARFGRRTISIAPMPIASMITAGVLPSTKLTSSSTRVVHSCAWSAPNWAKRASQRAKPACSRTMASSTPTPTAPRATTTEAAIRATPVSVRGS